MTKYFLAGTLQRELRNQRYDIEATWFQGNPEAAGTPLTAGWNNKNNPPRRAFSYQKSGEIRATSNA